MLQPRSMDEAFWKVIDEYEAREKREFELWNTFSAEEFARRRDEMLLAVGRAAGNLLNLLVKEGEAPDGFSRGEALTVTPRPGWRREHARWVVR